MGKGRIFQKNLRASLFIKYVSNEPNSSRIHFAGHSTFHRIIDFKKMYFCAFITWAPGKSKQGGPTYSTFTSEKSKEISVQNLNKSIFIYSFLG